jgi:hypothetical protein
VQPLSETHTPKPAEVSAASERVGGWVGGRESEEASEWGAYSRRGGEGIQPGHIVWQREGERRCSTTSSQSDDAMPGHSFERRNKRAAARRGSVLLRTGPHRSCNVSKQLLGRPNGARAAAPHSGFTVRMTADFVRGR